MFILIRGGGMVVVKKTEPIGMERKVKGVRINPRFLEN
jgi:hypothetical protein